MSFLNQDISQEENQNPVDGNVENNVNNNINTVDNASQGELEFNKKNREDFENLMQESSTQLDGYWDKNNPFVKLILLVLFGIIIAGVVYYILAYMGSR